MAVLSLLGFAWVKDIVGSCVFLIFGHEGVKLDVFDGLLTSGAAFFICSLNIAIQAIQCGARALIVDKSPPHQQDRANACASLMIGIGSVISYASSSFDVSGILSSQESSQVKTMSLLVSVILSLSVWLTCASTTEDNTFSFEEAAETKSDSAFGIFKQIFSAVQNLSALSKQVYLVQFFSWMGWFSFLTYNTM